MNCLGHCSGWLRAWIRSSTSAFHFTGPARGNRTRIAQHSCEKIVMLSLARSHNFCLNHRTLDWRRKVLHLPLHFFLRNLLFTWVLRVCWKWWNRVSYLPLSLYFLKKRNVLIPFSLMLRQITHWGRKTWWIWRCYAPRDWSRLLGSAFGSIFFPGCSLLGFCKHLVSIFHRTSESSVTCHDIGREFDPLW